MLDRVTRTVRRPVDARVDVFAGVTPNWFAAVMGTGIVAVAATSLPWVIPGLHSAALAVWLLAAALLVVLTVATAVHWVRYPAVARSHANHPVMAHFYGAPPMAILTVGAGTLLLGRDLLGVRVAVDLDWALWTVGTLGGLVTAVAVPYLALTRLRVTPADAFGGWLMPVVPPMVSASTGALLLPHAAAGLQFPLLVACYTMFALSAVASVVMITLIGRKVRRVGVGPAALVPTLWIVLGPLGQSITAAYLLGSVAHLAVAASYASALRGFGLAYGLPVWALALGWAAYAGAVTARTVRQGLPFGLPWWSFTFPVGTVVTGTSALFLHTGATLFRCAALVGYVGLVLAWAVVATRTARGVRSGTLFPAPPPLSGDIQP
jgi:C4-dicarboxylate transporter/malic acid transport protein